MLAYTLLASPTLHAKGVLELGTLQEKLQLVVRASIVNMALSSPNHIWVNWVPES